jgi:hypothetical protein
MTSPRSPRCGWSRDAARRRPCASCTRSRPPEAIAEAYFEHGVRTFSLDTIEELEKIVRATATDGVPATDLNLLRAAAVSSEHSKLSLASKFGADADEGASDGRPPGGRCAGHLLPCRQPGDEPGRPMPMRWRRCATPSSAAGVTVDIVDVGGGFPVDLSGHGAAAAGGLFRGDPPRVRSAADFLFGRTVVRAGPRAVRRICEPCWCASKRRGDELYINDGAYGALFDAAHIGWRFPVRWFAGRRPAATPATWTSASTARPATTWTIMAGRSSCRPTSRPATMSRSACSAPMAARCAPVQRLRRRNIVIVDRRADGQRSMLSRKSRRSKIGPAAADLPAPASPAGGLSPLGAGLPRPRAAFPFAAPGHSWSTGSNP